MGLRRFQRAFLLVAVAGSLIVAAGCHTPAQCPILQPLFGWNIVPPLPPADASYKVIGYRDGLRFYVIQYNDKIYRGGDICSRAGAESLKQLGIKTVISVTPDDQERALCREYGFTLVELPFETWSLSADILNKFLATTDKGQGPFYVHCKGGDLRAGILAAHYRIHREGWAYQRAVDEYYKLQGNFWDSVGMVQLLKDNASTPPTGAGAGKS